MPIPRSRTLPTTLSPSPIPTTPAPPAATTSRPHCDLPPIQAMRSIFWTGLLDWIKSSSRYHCDLSLPSSLLHFFLRNAGPLRKPGTSGQQAHMQGGSKFDPAVDVLKRRRSETGSKAPLREWAASI